MGRVKIPRQYDEKFLTAIGTDPMATTLKRTPYYFPIGLQLSRPRPAYCFRFPLPFGWLFLTTMSASAAMSMKTMRDSKMTSLTLLRPTRTSSAPFSHAMLA